MATVSPIDPPLDRSLESAVRKLRAREPLTSEERAAVRRRGWELVEPDLTDAPPPGATRSQPDLDRDEEDEALEDEVLAEADRREGRRGITREALFQRLRALG
jgi:hypothetical protein